MCKAIRDHSYYSNIQCSNDVIKEAQTFNCLDKGGVSNIQWGEERSIALMELSVVYLRSIFQKWDGAINVYPMKETSGLIQLEYYTGRCIKTCIEIKRRKSHVYDKSKVFRFEPCPCSI